MTLLEILHYSNIDEAKIEPHTILQIVSQIDRFFSINHIHSFYCYGNRLIIVSQVDLTDAPVGLGHDLVGEVHGVRDKDDAEDGHHDVDGDVDVGTLLHDGVHDI